MQAKFDKSSPELVARFYEIAPHEEQVVRKAIFGWPCLFINGNLFGGLHRQGLIVRLAEGELASILKRPDVVPFEPMPGRVMKGYVMITHPLDWKRIELANWMGKSLAFACQLPPKPKKPMKKERK